jgi:FAD/FMN-containing dehydrogenase
MSRATTFLEDLRRHMRGDLHGTDDPEFERLRHVWNGAIDQRPCAIACCADAQDVQLALRAASDRGIAVTVRGGGHSAAGLSVRDDALLIDLGRMRAVSVNADLRVAIVEGGALWRDVDAATARDGLATTGGMVSTTGVGGYTLGGGVGWLMRRHGLACDNLLGADLVLADGRSVRAAAGEYPELYWALRGGAGGFGVVTRFDFRLHPLSQVLAGLVVFPGEEAALVLRRFRDVVQDAPDELCGVLVLTSAPPLPFLDSAWHGRTVCIAALCWSGEVAAGERVLAPIRDAGAALADLVAPMPYAQWQQALDASAPPGRGQYWKTSNFASLNNAVIDVLAAAADTRPTPFTELHVQHLGGAVARLPSADSAFAHREAHFFVNLIGSTADMVQFDSMRAWIRDLHARLAAHAMSGGMPNFSGSDDQDALVRFGTDHALRLHEVRKRYDPQGVFAATRHAGAAGA